MKVYSKSKLSKIGLQFFGGITRLDAKQDQRLEILCAMNKAIGDNDQQAYIEAFDALGRLIEENVRGEFQQVQQQQDTTILTARGHRVLTSQERDYFTKVREAWKSSDPKQALTNLEVAIPETTINEIFKDIRTNHPLLSAINFRNTEAVVKFLLSTGGAAAQWGGLEDGYLKELSASFVEMKLTMCSLLAYIPVSKAMLDVGPEWIERYVRELLTESIALGLENGIVAGDGKKAPIGMMKKLTGAVDGVYPNKTAVAFNGFTPMDYSPILDTLATGPNDHARPVSEVIFLVNPKDYFTKVFPAVTVHTVDGGWNGNTFPFPTKVIQSVAVPQGKAIMGIASQYFMAIGGGTNGGRIEYSDDVKFMERERVYGVYLYGYGQARTENDFVLLDISGIKPSNLEVKIVNTEVPVNVTNTTAMPVNTKEVQG